MKSNDNPRSRKCDIVIQEFDNEILIYDLSKNKAYCLNETSAKIWQECDGEKSAPEISRILSKKTKTNVNEDIVWLALNQLKKDDLLEESDKFVTPLDGLNRREIVKRIGLASMVALPIIAAVVAPTASLAASGLTNCAGFGTNGGTATAGCPCNMSNADCVMGCNCGQSPSGTFTCCAIDPTNTCVPGNNNNLSVAGCVCAMSNAECVPGCNCGASVSIAGIFTCCAL